MNGQLELKLTKVLRKRGAKQVGEIRDRWSWVEPSVWTERMLTALESGVEGGKWFSLIDKVYAEKNLRAAFGRVAANDGKAGMDGQTIEKFEAKLEHNLGRLHRMLIDGSYAPQPVKRVWIPKADKKSKRPLGIPTVSDRVVQSALRKRRGGSGRGRGTDHQRWPNAYFAERGLFSLSATYESACRSSRR